MKTGWISLQKEYKQINNKIDGQQSIKSNRQSTMDWGIGS